LPLSADALGVADRLFFTVVRWASMPEELLREVWGFRSLGRTRTLDSHASRLRRKLSAAGGDFVRNVWGVGYSLLNDST
jgi:DNA-binding response OmpR family regulator